MPLPVINTLSLFFSLNGRGFPFPTQPFTCSSEYYTIINSACLLSLHNSDSPPPLFAELAAYKFMVFVATVFSLLYIMLI